MCMVHSYGVLITINLLNVFTLLGEKQLEEFDVWKIIQTSNSSN